MDGTGLADTSLYDDLNTGPGNGGTWLPSVPRAHTISIWKLNSLPAQPAGGVRRRGCSRRDAKMIQTEELATQLPTPGRQTKFTPERLQQIRNLVERGKSREEIAELIGVTVGSLQVTCSRLTMVKRDLFHHVLEPNSKQP